MNDVVDDFVEVELPMSDNFLKVKETLERIGIASYKKGKLYQSCHILHKRGRYYIVHFKELFKLDGKPSTLTKEDVRRRNTIANLLEEWGLVNIINDEIFYEGNSNGNFLPMKKIRIIPYKDKDKWVLIQKYNLGNT